MRVDPSTARVPLDASTREALERVRLYLPLDSRHPAHAALALIESTLERYEDALREIADRRTQKWPDPVLAHAEACQIARAALTPETEQPDFWRPDGRCPEC